jgi:hypothetical protein
MFSLAGWRLLLNPENPSWRPKNNNVAFIDKKLKTAIFNFFSIETWIWSRIHQKARIRVK